MSKATEFLAWLIEDINEVTAEVGSPRDAQMKVFERDGFLRLSGIYHGTSVYEITSKGAVGWMEDAK